MMWTQILSWILTVLLVAAGAIILILKLVVPKIVNSAVDYQFSRKLDDHRNELAVVLEDHKHQLQQITLAETHNYQRLIRDFDLFTTKRHEIYPELFKAVLKADGEIRSLWGGRYSPTFEDFNDKDIKQYLESKHVPSGKIDIFLNLWRTPQIKSERKRTIDEIKEYIRTFEILHARKTLEQARSYYYLSEIYLSDHVSKAVDEALKLIIEFLVNVETPEKSKYFQVDHNKPIEDSLSNIKNIMRQELGIGDYAEAE